MLLEHGFVSLVMKKGSGGGWQCLLRGQVGFLAAMGSAVGPHRFSGTGSVRAPSLAFTPTPSYSLFLFLF